MKILIVFRGKIPVLKYGGTQRFIWYLGKELVKKGHDVSYLVEEGSSADFADVVYIDNSRLISEQIPDDVDIVHLNNAPGGEIKKPYVRTFHGNCNDYREFDQNTVFVSRNHASRFNSDSFVYNGLDWDDYGIPELNNKREYFHFLGDAAWRVKNVKGAIKVVSKSRTEKLRVLGGYRFNISMGLRLTLNLCVRFEGIVGGERKIHLLQNSKGLVFPVRWHEPFGLAITESLYMGCPVFGTPYGSLPELVTPEVGFLSNKRSELTNAILDANKYSRKACHEYARDKFNSSIMAEAYLEKYAKVMSGEKLNPQKPKLVKKQEVKFLEWNQHRGGVPRHPPVCSRV